MIRWLSALVIVGCAVGVARAQPARLAPSQLPGGAIEREPPTIELVTFGVGAVIFEKFGHAAICLRYLQPEHPTICFNYGVTNFHAGASMIWNFLRIEQKFWVEPASADSLFGFYRWEDRDIWVQTLPISGEAARAIEARLWRDQDEAHRYYNYDRFADNCSTRLRDIDLPHGLRARRGAEAFDAAGAVGPPALAGGAPAGGDGDDEAAGAGTG